MGRGMERAREAACVVCRAWCVVRGRSLYRRAEEQLTVICVETAALWTKGVWISSQNLHFTIVVASSEGSPRAIYFEPSTARVTRRTFFKGFGAMAVDAVSC